MLFETRELLDQVKRWEEMELGKTDGGSQNPPAFLSAPRKSISKLAPLNSDFGDEGLGGGPAQLLRNEIASLSEENGRLRQRVKDLEMKTTSLLSQKENSELLSGKKFLS